MNQITEIRVTLIGEHYRLFVTKEFEPEYGGGETTFALGSYAHPHRALDAAKEALTLSPSTREGYIERGAEIFHDHARVGNTPTCEDCGAPQDDCECVDDLCITGNPARNGICGDPDCFCAPGKDSQ